MHRWGYAPTTDVLAEELLGGRVEVEELRSTIDSSEKLREVDGFACLRGSERLVTASRRRVRSNRRHQQAIRQVAGDFTRDLLRACPFIEAVALSGSVASGAYEPGDDIDFDLFVQTGTKYACYLIATLVGLKYAWRNRHAKMNTLHRTPLLPKLTCINVLWPADQTKPFVRQDAALAFELLRCQPLVGADRFQTVLADNPWLQSYFPQLFERVPFDDLDPSASPIRACLAAVGRRPRLLRFVEAASRRLAWIAYRFVQGTRQQDPVARERMDFLRRVKYPYEVFQD